MPPFIEAKGLTKQYTRLIRPEKGGALRLLKRERVTVEALTDLTFSAEAGELIGLIGPNGAGKSTTVKLLTGILTPTSGECRIAGRTPWEDRSAHVRGLGAVFGQRTQLWWDVPILDSYELLRDVYSLPQSSWRSRLDELADALDLTSLLRTPLRQLSLGQRMRAELCGSLLHSPRLLFLDEPTIGLDAVSKLKLRAFLQQENQRGTAIILTTHDMEDMLALCSRVMVLGHGRLLYDGALDALLHHYDAEHTLRCTFSAPPVWAALPEGLRLSAEGDATLISFDPAHTPVSDVLALVMSAGELREMTLKEQSVDAMIARMYGEMAL